MPSIEHKDKQTILLAISIAYPSYIIIHKHAIVGMIIEVRTKMDRCAPMKGKTAITY